MNLSTDLARFFAMSAPIGARKAPNISYLGTILSLVRCLMEKKHYICELKITR